MPKYIEFIRDCLWGFIESLAELLGFLSVVLAVGVVGFGLGYFHATDYAHEHVLHHLMEHEIQHEHDESWADEPEYIGCESESAFDGMPSDHEMFAECLQHHLELDEQEQQLSPECWFEEEGPDQMPYHAHCDGEVEDLRVANAVQTVI